MDALESIAVPVTTPPPWVPAVRFLERVPIAYARQHAVLGLQPAAEHMPVLMGRADSRSCLAKIATLIGQPTRGVAAAEPRVLEAIDQAYAARDTAAEAVIDELAVPDLEALTTELRCGSSDLLDDDAASPITRIVNALLLDAVRRRASDVHVQPSESTLAVRLRIDGVLYDHLALPAARGDAVVSRIKVMGRMNIAEKRLSQDGRTTVQVGQKVIDLRISTLPTSHGERVVMRLLDKSARLYRLGELGMADSELTVLRRLIRRPHGILLVTGPTGSGKSTTLYAALQEMNHRELNILTLEDPIEYQLPGISQTQVSSIKGMTFATGLRTVLRQDPDVIMVGEIRDHETARMAIQSSLTGHLVFSTLHTNDAAGAIARLLDLGVEPYLVASSLLGVLAQRLVRRVCAQCSRTRPLRRAERQELQTTQTQVCTGTGCAACFGTGYVDRMGIFELLEIREDLQPLIAAGARSQELRRAAQRSGMRSLRDSAVVHLEAGHTTVEEVLRVTHVEGDASSTGAA